MTDRDVAGAMPTSTVVLPTPPSGPVVLAVPQFRGAPAIGVICCALTVLAGLASTARAATLLTDVVSSSLFFGFGALLLNEQRKRPNRFLVLAGLAITIFSVEILLDQVDRAIGRTGLIILETGMSVVLMVLIAVALSRRHRQRVLSSFFAQAAAEAVLVGALLCVVSWRWLFEPVLDLTQWPDVLVLIQMVLNLALLGLTVVAVTYDGDRGMNLACAGLGLLIAIDVWVLRIFVGDGSPETWLPRSICCLGWALVVVGIQRISVSVRPTADEALAGFESRRLLVVWGLLLLAAAVMLTLIREPRMDRPTWAFFVVFLVALFARDFSQARRSRLLLSRLGNLARRDPLTGLGNRRALDEDEARLRDQSITVLLVDLDKFKDVNDLLGHAAGDQLLRTVAAHLAALAGPLQGRVYRMGGDEFALVLPERDGGVDELAEHIVQTVRAAAGKVTGVSPLHVGASIGIQSLPFGDRQGLHEALVSAGQAMRAAKTDPAARVRYFDEALREDYRRRKLIEVRLREQLDAVGLAYQPLIEASTGRVAGFEALARWIDPVLGVVHPTEFIEVAEHTGLIPELGERLLAVALGELGESGLLTGDRFLSVNVSPLQLIDPTFAERVLHLPGRYGLTLDQLLIEVTESVAITSEGAAHQSLRLLAEAGVQLAIDDFGSGSTSVGYLTTLPVSALKIDRSLTAGADPRGVATLRGVVELSHALGLAVILEGVETAEQHELAQRLRVRYTQGWLYARAAPLAELAELVQRLDARAGARPVDF